MISRRACVGVLLLMAVLAGRLSAQTSDTTARTNTVDRGAINGAAFYIEIPARWNKGLVLYTHGYTVAGTRPPDPDSPRLKVPAALAGTSERFVARFVEANGHCNFTPEQTGTAFDALVVWARDGKRPAAGEQK